MADEAAAPAKKRMSVTERLIRDAVGMWADTSDSEEDDDETGNTVRLSDRLLLDGTASISRLSNAAAPQTMKRLSTMRRSLTGAKPSDETTTRKSSAQPPPPPAPIQSEASAAAIEAAKQRRASLKAAEP
jgi:hypothetical protein